MLTAGRFHLVDLARELSQLGHEVRVYSLVPAHRTRRFGLPGECSRWLGGLVAPAYAATKLARGRPVRELADHALVAAIDAAACHVVEPCDIFLGMSGIAVRTVDTVKRKYGARVFLERLSRHVLSQRAILERIPGIEHPVPDWAVDRELAGYGLADTITVPSTHALTSFLEYGFPADRLFRNPLGTALDTFRPTVAPPDPPTILMTGAWSRRKGCDVLVDAWRRLPGTRLVHVGPVTDAPLPSDPHFEHVDPVPQHELAQYYARAHVFALASREDGFGLVLLQALACGVPIVCTTRTGGEDVRAWCVRPDAVQIVPPEDPEQLATALATALRQSFPAGRPRDLLGDQRAETSWRAYATRYEARMRQALDEKPQ